MRTLHALRYEQDLSQQDIAQRLGLSRLRVRQLLDRMLRDLARLMKEADIPGIPSHG
jgi:DNA-directed RNA polymerase specialized sigma subunit